MNNNHLYSIKYFDIFYKSPVIKMQCPNRTKKAVFKRVAG